MNINDDLARWGEPPAGAGEEDLAERLALALHSVRQGQPLPSTEVSSPTLRTLTPDAPDLTETLTVVEELVQSLRDPAPVPPVADLPDPFSGEFRILKELPGGGFSKVWLAEDLHIGRKVALKQLKPPREGAKDVLALLRHEARLLDRVRHPNIVTIHAVRRSGDDYYLVLDYIEGGSLKGRLEEQGPFPWPRACRYVADVGEALLQVHAQGIVHRDVKPANILWNSDKDEAVLTDFGVSCRLTEPGSAAGTIPYLAPESLDGKPAPALDVFALAATLFQLTTGALPFPARDLLEHVGRVLDGLPEPDPRCASVPPDVQEWIRAGLAADPARRPTLDAFVEGLRGVLNRQIIDDINSPDDPPPVHLQLLVSRDAGEHGYVPVPAVHPQRRPAAPDRVRLRTHDRIRIQVRTDRPGYVLVFNIGPTGNLHVLWPAGSTATGRLEADRTLDVLEVEVKPPAGRERLVACWSRLPLPLSQVLPLTGQAGEGVSRPYRATRDLEHVDQTMRKLDRADWHVVLLELEHED